MTAQLHVTLIVTPSQQFFDGSGILAGLAALKQAGVIKLRIRRGKVFDSVHRALVCFSVDDPEHGRRQIVIDLSDRADKMSLRLLEWADVYYKRSYSIKTIRSLSNDNLERKIKPYGLNLACLGIAATPTFVTAATLLFADRMLGVERRSLLSSLTELFRICRMAPFLPAPRAFERRDLLAPTTVVALQTRIWPPEPSLDNLAGVNADRIALVRALKNAFGAQFVGGIMADEYSLQHCPTDVLVQHNLRRAAYINLLKGASIGVYIRGLHHAIAIKMAEYMAAGLCIVSEPISFEIPVPLIEGVNYLSFRTNDECVERCRWLVSHPADAARMRSANIEYFQKWVSPKVLVKNLLSRAYEQDGTLRRAD